MSSRPLFVLSLCVPLLSLACSGPTGLRAQGDLSVSGTTAAGPFSGSFSFPVETRIDASDGLTAMCQITRSNVDGVVIRTVTLDLIPASGGALEAVSVVARAGSLTGSVDADVRGDHFSTSSCTWAMDPYVGDDGVAQIRSLGECTLTNATGGTATANVDLVVRGCSVIDL